MNLIRLGITCILITITVSQHAKAAIALDRTRAIFDGNRDAMSLKLRNDSRQNPYLAQVWLEDEQGNRITSPFIVTPPLQRIEASQNSQIRIQRTPDAQKSLPSDRESVYYLSVREIPPRNKDGENYLQIALQTRIKMFYRPASIQAGNDGVHYEQGISLSIQGNRVTLGNDTPYFLTVLDIENPREQKITEPFDSRMLAPHSDTSFERSSERDVHHVKVYYVNDFGGVSALPFNCTVGQSQCERIPQ